MQKWWRAGAVVFVLATAMAPRLLGQDSVAVGRRDSAGVPAPRTSTSDTSFVVDRVVAIVGNRPVLASQVEEKVFTTSQAERRPLPKDEAGMRALRQQAVNDIIDEELLVQQAQRDTTIKVTDEEISEGTVAYMRNFRQDFPSEAEYRAELKKTGFQTAEEYRRWLSDQQRRAALQNRLIDKLQLKPVRPTDQEIRAFYDARKATMGKRPAMLSFRQIVITPKAAPEAKEKARTLADSIATELRNGANFAAAARRFSGDPASRELGGDLNWFRRGVMVPEFEREAFRLKPGVISYPVETPFGYHIIQVQRVQPAEVQARHILIVPEVDSARIDSARTLADSLSRALKAGAPFDSLQRLYHDRSAERSAENVPVDKLPEDYATAIGAADSGAIAPVFKLPGTGQRPQFVVLEVVRRRPEGEVRYEDVKDQIYDELSKRLPIRRYIDGLKRSTFIEVRS